jgi:uncharacterized protein with PIN domain
MIDVKLEAGVKGYNIVRKKCPNCSAEFIFKIDNDGVYDVIGEGYNYPEDKVVRCKICLSAFKYEVIDTSFVMEKL